MSREDDDRKVFRLLMSFEGAESKPVDGDREFHAFVVLADMLKKIEETGFTEMEVILATITRNLVKIASIKDKQKYLMLVQAEIIETIGLTPDQKNYFTGMVTRLSDQVNNS